MNGGGTADDGMDDEGGDSDEDAEESASPPLRAAHVIKVLLSESARRHATPPRDGDGAGGDGGDDGDREDGDGDGDDDDARASDAELDSSELKLALATVAAEAKPLLSAPLDRQVRLTKEVRFAPCTEVDEPHVRRHLAVGRRVALRSRTPCVVEAVEEAYVKVRYQLGSSTRVEHCEPSDLVVREGRPCETALADPAQLPPPRVRLGDALAAPAPGGGPRAGESSGDSAAAARHGPGRARPGTGLSDTASA